MFIIERGEEAILPIKNSEAMKYCCKTARTPMVFRLMKI